MHRAVELSATYNHRSPITVQVMRNRSSITVGMLRGLLDTKRSVGDKPSRPLTHLHAFSCPAAHNNGMPDPCQKPLLNMLYQRKWLFIILPPRAKLQYPDAFDRDLATGNVFVSLVSGQTILQTDRALCAIRCTRLEGYPESGYRFLLLLVIIYRFNLYMYRVW